MAGVLTDAALAASVAVEAGELLLEMRERMGFYDPYELGDAGDMRANTLILDRLHRERPHDAILSEEAVDDVSRVHADRVWIVDPVDGTYEYSMPGRADWAVHIALWQRSAGTLTDAAVALPARGEVFRSDTVTPPPPRADGPIRITASSNRPPAILWRIRDQLDVQLYRIGSAGAKAMAVVRGDVDAYLHAGGQWEWDSAAPAGVLWAAGLHATRLDGSPLIYNRRDPYLPDLLMCRPEVADTLLAVIRSGMK
ncbi:3'(2'),5'-bisphosphate nucleotidase CysQ [Mycolicibacterium iranicum]|uniref:3'(2'),5-bisphosphonucleoside 3'(2')-phosphohydrolase n=1 Tax=Mycolicibacterium iranicum TaxID=912594 RepID=A0A1X1WWD4_MYCIR|nr:3'(2'),5'-bisphosphate nucleotidase CysQ [Mycolicibacterium iranicum]MCZ0728140.1 3'(2'),5'-bisphosphate nucleotidase CysQ [Mycolicibacterium iranicum]ORV90945.1 3'(2'),5'-bisphosphate nucleotidase CysQ [Mycolicibacterium iranicum]